MILAPYVAVLAAVSGCSAQSIVTRVLAGQQYCHEAALTPTWTVDAAGDEAILGDFRDGRGELEYRSAGPDSILVSFDAKKYHGMTSSRVYSSKKLLVPLKGPSLVRPRTDAQWNAAATLTGTRTPLLSPSPTAPQKGQEEPIRFHEFEFAPKGQHGKAFAASPGGDWISVLSWSGVLRGDFSLEPAHGTMYVDVYDVSSGKKAIQIQLDFRDTEPEKILPHAVWISDRHFVFPLNRLKTKLMVCDLRPTQDSSKTVWNIVGNNAEILGFREEASIHDVAGTIGLTLHVGVQVPEAGTYRLSATIEDEKGLSKKQSKDHDLAAMTNLVQLGIDVPRDLDGVLRIRDVILERVVGQTATPVARRDLLGTIGPYKQVIHPWDPRTKALQKIQELETLTHRDPVVLPKMGPRKPSPLTSRTLPGKIETLTQAPANGGKLEGLRLKVDVPPVAGRCTWFANIEANGKILMTASTPLNSATPPESVIFEFPGKSMFPDTADEGDLRMSTITVVCFDETFSWFHQFDQFPGYVIPGIRLSMMQRGTLAQAALTGHNQVEFLDTDHDGKYEAIKVTLGFKSDRKCDISPRLTRSNGSTYPIWHVHYDPSAGNSAVVLYIGFTGSYIAGEQFLEVSNISCEASDGFLRPVPVDKNARVPLVAFTSEQFQPPIELTFENDQPIQENGEFVYKINCTPRWPLDLPLEFSVEKGMPATGVSLDPVRGSCKPHATTLRFKPHPDAPAFPYVFSVLATVDNGNIFARASTNWVKPAVPEVLGVLPSTGSGKRALFRVAADDLSTGVPKIELLFSESGEISHACHIVITTTRTIALTDDDGQAVKESKYPEWPSVQNSQCTIEKGYFCERVPVSFKTAFGGSKNIYVRAWNGAGATSGWVKQGTWAVSQNERPIPIAVTPYAGTGDHQTFTFTFADPNGGADLEKLEALIAFAPSDQRACHLTVDRAAGRVFLEGGDSVNLGSLVSLSNSQCVVGKVRVIEENGRALRLSADVRFTADFRGRRNVFLKSADKSKLESDWLWAGSWDIH